MPTLAEAAKGCAGDLDLLRRHGNDLGVGEPEEPLEPLAPGLAFAALDDEGRLDARGGGDEPPRIVLDPAVEGRALGLVEEDGYDGRGVEHHQRGTPYSS